MSNDKLILFFICRSFCTTLKNLS